VTTQVVAHLGRKGSDLVPGEPPVVVQHARCVVEEEHTRDVDVVRGWRIGGFGSGRQRRDVQKAHNGQSLDIEIAEHRTAVGPPGDDNR
jgi:hypothetical protein